MNNISNSTSNTIVMGTTGDDSIDSSGDFVSINAGEGNNYISSGNGKNVSINSGAGNDSINNYGDNVTINGGAAGRRSD